jgi:hypothetical protein
MRALGLLAAALSTTACAQPAETQDAAVLPAAYVDLLTAQTSVPSTVRARAGQSAKLCAADEALWELYPGRGVRSVVRENPYEPVRGSAAPGTCDVRIVAELPPAAFELRREFPSCVLGIDAEGRTSIAPMPGATAEAPASVLGECFYRHALYLVGYDGAFDAGNFELGDKSAYFAGRPWVGSRATWVAADILAKCPEAREFYFSAKLKEQLEQSCRTALNRRGY